jgi:hypothetical protein
VSHVTLLDKGEYIRRQRSLETPLLFILVIVCLGVFYFACIQENMGLLAFGFVLLTLTWFAVEKFRYLTVPSQETFERNYVVEAIIFVRKDLNLEIEKKEHYLQLDNLNQVKKEEAERLYAALISEKQKLNKLEVLVMAGLKPPNILELWQIIDSINRRIGGDIKKGCDASADTHLP